MLSYVCIHVCMYVCMYVYTHLYIYIYRHIHYFIVFVFLFILSWSLLIWFLMILRFHMFLFDWILGMHTFSTERCQLSMRFWVPKAGRGGSRAPCWRGSPTLQDGCQNSQFHHIICGSVCIWYIYIYSVRIYIYIYIYIVYVYTWIYL